MSTFKNPLSLDNIADLLAAMLQVLIVVSTPIIIFFIIYSGFTYVTAGGNPEKIQQASRSLMFAIIGGVIILGSVAITTVLINLVKAF